MKIYAGALIAAAVLAGCAQNPLAKLGGSDTRTSATEPAQAVPAPQPQAAAPQAQVSAPALPPCVDTPEPKAASNDRKSKAKGKQAKAVKEPAAAPCAKPAPTPAPVATAVAPAAPTQATVPATSAGKQEVKGINDWTGYIQGTPAPNSKFANLKIGMGQKEAMDIAGTPTDQGAHVTGKAFIPFYMGSGAVETWLHYKGVGRLLFASNGGFSTSTGLIGIEHDANERGYR
jgi:hypothetical protein